MEADLNASKSLLVLALTLAALSAAAPGCKSNGDAELLERELRGQEDRIYQLEDELDDAQYALEASRRENQSLKGEMAGGDRGAGSSFTPSSRPSTPSLPKVDVPALEAPQIDVPDSDAPATAPPGDEAPPFRFVPKQQEQHPAEPNTLPEIDLPVPEAVEPGDAAPRFEQTSHKEPVLTGDASKVAKLVFNRQLTGGWNPNHKHGDEGVFVAFEPRDAQNQLVAAPGSISVVVLDPAQTGGAARVGRWDFTVDEAAACFRTKGLGRGYQFELPWPSKPPANRDLRLFVRFETAEGRRIEADARIRVTLYDGWTTKAATAEAAAQAETASTEPQSRLVESKPAAKKSSPTRPVRTASRPRWAPQR
jgi:hypothetical protein